MKEFTYKKSSWRYLFVALAAYGGAKVIQGLWLLYWILQPYLEASRNETASVGIIGGADGPTAIFVTSHVWITYLVPLALMIVGIWGFLKLSKLKKKGISYCKNNKRML